MRQICLTLLLFNLVYFGYAQLRPQSGLESPVSRAGQSGVARLMLVRERARLSDASPTGSELAEEVLAEPITRLADPSTGLSPVKVALGGGSCSALGPFSDLFQGQKVVERLVELGVNVYLKAVDSPSEDQSYRVMLPPAKSKVDAFRLLKALGDQSIDSYVMTDGKDALAISLGVFSTETAALKLHGKVLKRGYKPVVSEMIRYERQFWAFYEPKNQSLNLAGDVSSIATIVPNMRLQQKQCPET